MSEITIAIDGYSSCGKSTLAKQLAKALGYSYIDTGAMFRAVAYYCLTHGLLSEDGTEVYKIKDFLDDINVDFEFDPKTEQSYVRLNGVVVENEIRNLTISSIVTKISGIKEVREKLRVLQRDLGDGKSVVLDGRDIGTVVFPKAELKLFMTAETEIRAKRRYDELRSKGEKISMDDVRKNLQMRDHDDTTRKEGPLKQAEDAVVIDNSQLTRGDQLSMILALANQRKEEVTEEEAV